MDRRLIPPIAATALLGIVAVVGVTRGSGSGVTAAGDDRFRIDGTTLTAYLGDDTFVTLPDTITVIGEEAFRGNTTLTSLEIPDSVTAISYNAFKDCTALTNVIIPDSVTRVGPGAFEGCTALTSVEIGENVSSWGTGVFTNCSALGSAYVDKDNDYITEYNGALYNGNMTMLYQVLPAREGDNYVMPESVRDMDTYAFWNLVNTKNVKLSDKITVVPTYSMTNMGSVQNVILTDSVAAIEEKAFAGSAALMQVGIPESVKSINKSAFKDCPENMMIYTKKGTTADTFGKDNDITVIYDAQYPKDFMDSNVNMEELPNLGGQGQTNTNSADLTDTDNDNSDTDNSSGNTSTGGDSAGGDGTLYLEDYPADEGWLYAPEGYDSILDAPDDDSVIGKTIVAAGQAVMLMNNHDGTVYGVPDGVKADVMTEAEEKEQSASESETQAADTEKDNSDNPSGNADMDTSISVTISPDKQEKNVSIPQREYYRQKNLTSFEIDDTVQTIGRLAFAESGLKAIDIPENVTAIEYGAFMNCSALSDVEIPDTVESIATRAFSGTAWLNEWLKGGKEGTDDDFLVVGDGILLAYRGNEEYVTIPDGVKQIGSEVFKGHTEIINVAVPSSVTKICAEAFRNCDSLIGLSGCEGLRTVIRGAFYGTQISETEFGN